MKVSFFKSVKETAPKVSKDVGAFLDRIKKGSSRDIVEQIRTTVDKEEQQALKMQLPGVCFNGYFSNRSKKGLKTASGLMVLDFDDFDSNDSAMKFKETLKQDKHIFSAWLSPRMGVKALYRIIPVDDDSHFKDVYIQVKERYPELDDSGKDISRFCYESFDPNIYINLNAEVFVPEVRVESDNDLGVITNIPIKDQDLIANRLVKWFDNHYDRSQRNNSVYKLAAAFNDFGVDKSTATMYCNRYAEKGFTVSEIGQIIESAYKNTSSFGTKFFEDGKRIKKLTNMVLTGKKAKELQKEFSDIDQDKLEREVKAIQDSVNVDEFWKFDHNGKIKIEPYRFKLYLESLNFRKYYPVGNDKTFVFITKNNNFLDNINEFQIKDKVMNNLLVNDEVDVFNACADNTKIFTDKYMSFLETANVEVEKDGKDYSLLYYENSAVKVTKDKVECIDYEDLDGYIWKDQVINREYTKADHHESMFRSFVWLISGEETDRYNTMKSVIGYLLHSFKTSANNKAIILNDEVISDNPNGGSGKGLLTNAISHMKKVSTIDGKVFDFNKSFPYQTVSTDCQVLAFDDVKKNFNFEQLFSIITEGITIEYKGKDAVKLPITESPKVLISTNYTIKADGGSFERRMFEVELSSYFGSHHTPLDEFKCMLFQDWDEKEWARFDQYMINCLQYFLENGLVGYEQKNLKLRKFINQTSSEFYDYMSEKSEYKRGERIFYKSEYNEFIEEYEDFKKWLNQRTFNKWLNYWFDYKGHEVESKSSQGQRYYEVVNGEELINTDSGLAGYDEFDPF